MSTQVFEVSDIPSSLWDPTYTHGDAELPPGKLRLPVRLEQAYRQALDELGLTAIATNLSDRGDGTIGEATQEGARKHFAKRFSGSCGRIQLFALDPHHTFKTTRSALATVFSAGRVRLLDIPLGAGAGAISLVSLVAQLRAESQPIFPKIDLDVQVVGGDNNPHQIEIANRMFRILKPWWLEQGLNADLETVEWDVLSDEATSDLIERWRGGLDGETLPAVICSNFSGFLAQTNPQDPPRLWIDEAESCLRQLFAAVAAQRAMTFWIEPAGKDSQRRVFPKLRPKVFGRFKRIVPTSPSDPTSKAFQGDPIVINGGFAARVTGIHLVSAA